MSDLEYRIGKLDLSPGDVLVVKVNAILSREQAEFIEGKFQPFMPDGVRVMPIGRDTDLSVMPGVLTLNGGLSPERAADLKASWEQVYTGHHDRPAVL